MGNKGISAETITGNIGIPKREFIGETKWREAKPNNKGIDLKEWAKSITEMVYDDFMAASNKTEDIDYIDVTNETKLLGDGK